MKMVRVKIIPQESSRASLTVEGTGHTKRHKTAYSSSASAEENTAVSHWVRAYFQITAISF